ncbi:unnamed protein product [Aureobasidium mustum]|uniref:Uncharacterized protein n=1 Tax=Aureobasidium mustum TaxID=2773714 RepID=A0A9N8JSQ6_9PEZI|nr:unnamed protein product [Aureobasidium mustum]
MPVKPITGMLRRGLVLDLSVAFGLGTSAGYLWWYGTHKPHIPDTNTIDYQPTPTYPYTTTAPSAPLSKRKRKNTQTDGPSLSGFHVPAVRRRDLFYAKLEDERAAALGQL